MKRTVETTDGGFDSYLGEEDFKPYRKNEDQREWFERNGDFLLLQVMEPLELLARTMKRQEKKEER